MAIKDRYFFDPVAGNDTKAGKSKDKALKTLVKVKEKYKENDCIYVKKNNGEYYNTWRKYKHYEIEYYYDELKNKSGEVIGYKCYGSSEDILTTAYKNTHDGSIEGFLTAFNDGDL